MSDYYPFIIFLLILIIEKICIMWLKDKFGTTPQVINQFIQIEENYIEAKNQIKK